MVGGVGPIDKPYWQREIDEGNERKRLRKVWEGMTDRQREQLIVEENNKMLKQGAYAREQQEIAPFIGAVEIFARAVALGRSQIDTQSFRGFCSTNNVPNHLQQTIKGMLKEQIKNECRGNYSDLNLNF